MAAAQDDWVGTVGALRIGAEENGVMWLRSHLQELLPQDVRSIARAAGVLTRHSGGEIAIAKILNDLVVTLAGECAISQDKVLFKRNYVETSRNVFRELSTTDAFVWT